MKPQSGTRRQNTPWRPALLPVLGAFALVFAAWSILRNAPSRAEALPLSLPPVRPVLDGNSTAGVGLVEPASEVIALAPHVAGVVEEVRVRPGDAVATNTVVMRIEDSETRRQLEAAEAVVKLERMRLARLTALPRQEELPAARARLQAAMAENAEAQTRFISRRRVGGQFVAPEEIEIARQGVLATTARVEESSASLALLMAGAWKPELEQQKAAVETAEAEVARVRSRLELHSVRAPIAGTILRVGVRPGEYAATGQANDSLIEMGDCSRLHVRVEVDEEDLARLELKGRAQGYLRGDGSRVIPLSFVRIEPSVRPKRNLSGSSSERIDTRIAELIYRVAPDAPDTSSPGKPLGGLLVGRQMDVYILAASDK